MQWDITETRGRFLATNAIGGSTCVKGLSFQQQENKMPKGYNDKAIDGMLTFLEGCFEVILQEVKKGKSVEQAMQEELEEIRERLLSDRTVTAPDIVFRRRA